MKILITGGTHAHSLEAIYYDRLRKLFPENEVALYPISDDLSLLLKKSLLNKLSFRLNLSSLYTSINIALLKYIDIFLPDIVVVFKGMEILPNTLKQLKKKGILLVNYNADHPFFFSGPGSGNLNVTRSISLYNLHVTYHPLVLKQLHALGLHAKLLPFGFDDEWIDVTQSIQLPEQIQRAVFIGNPDNERIKWIKGFIKEGMKIDLYGHGWGNYFNEDICFDAVYNQSYIHIARSYRVNLNIFREHNYDSHNMRTIELGAIGALQLAHFSKQVKSIYSSQSCIYTYTNAYEAVEAYQNMLSLPHKYVESIIMNNRQHLVHQGYSYTQLAGKLYHYLKEI